MDSFCWPEIVSRRMHKTWPVNVSTSRPSINHAGSMKLYFFDPSVIKHILWVLSETVGSSWHPVLVSHPNKQWAVKDSEYIALISDSNLLLPFYFVVLSYPQILQQVWVVDSDNLLNAYLMVLPLHPRMIVCTAICDVIKDWSLHVSIYSWFDAWMLANSEILFLFWIHAYKGCCA